MNTLPPSRQLRAPLYAVTRELENNYYDDSDFYVIAFDPNTRTLRRVETWTTRFACVPRPGREFVPMEETPQGVKADAMAALAEVLALTLLANELKEVHEPDADVVKKGLRLRLSRKVCTRGEHGTLQAGLAGEVFWYGAHGRFFRNGYNRPDRNNTRVGLKLDDGRKVFVVLNACRLDREVRSNEEVWERAKELAAKECFTAPFSHVGRIR